MARYLHIAEQLSAFTTYISPRRRSDNLTRTSRKQAGCWLRELREKRGLSPRELAQQESLASCARTETVHAVQHRA